MGSRELVLHPKGAFGSTFASLFKMSLANLRIPPSSGTRHLLRHCLERKREPNGASCRAEPKGDLSPTRFCHSKKKAEPLNGLRPTEVPPQNQYQIAPEDDFSGVYERTYVQG
jgi:hypothetical protein